MMKIYGSPTSTCTRKVMLTLNEKNIPFTMEVINIAKGEQKQPAYLHHQPFGVVPVLEDGDYEIYESHAIMHYVDKKFVENALAPIDPHVLGRMEQWISVAQSYFTQPTVTLVKELYFGPMQGKVVDQQLVSEAKDKVAHALDVIEKNLSMHPYMVANDFTLADITWMPYVEYLFPASMGQLVTERPSLNAWWEKVSKRPAWQKVLAWKQ
jgi:glutathione S-transferase